MRNVDEQQTIRVHQMLSEITTLGPYKRFVLWTQGCMRRCVGCISPASRSFEGGKDIAIGEIAKAALCYPHEGITISGGEPFLQAHQLCNLIDLISTQRDMGVILYTGYTLEELQSTDAPMCASELLQRVDLLIDGPYIQELNDDGNLRGSSNQRVLPLTDRYMSFLNMYGVVGKRATQVRITAEGFFIAGIPSKVFAETNHLGKE